MLTRNNPGIRALRRLKRYFTRHQRNELQQMEIYRELRQIQRGIQEITHTVRSNTPMRHP